MSRGLGAIGFEGSAFGRAESRGQIYEGRKEIEEYLQDLQDKLQKRQDRLGKGKFLSKLINFIVPAALAATGNIPAAMAARKALPFVTAGGRRLLQSDIEKKLDLSGRSDLMFSGSRGLLSGIKEAKRGATNIRQASQVGTLTDLIGGYFAGKAGQSAGEFLGGMSDIVSGTAGGITPEGGGEVISQYEPRGYELGMNSAQQRAMINPTLTQAVEVVPDAIGSVQGFRDTANLLSWMNAEPQFNNLYGRSAYGGGYRNA